MQDARRRAEQAGRDVAVAVAGSPCVRACERLSEWETTPGGADGTDVRLSRDGLASVVAGAGLRSASRDVEAASGVGKVNENENENENADAEAGAQNIKTLV